MELWIRSQDKERIIKINQLDVMKLDTDVDPRYNHFGIYANEYLVGEYKTKERALEVLDEIQKLLQPQMVLSKVGKPIAETCDGTVYVNPDEYEIQELSTYVYEMPKE